MAKGKKDDEQATVSTATKGQASLASKKAQRAAQSAKDRAFARGAKGYAPRKPTTPADRCKVCGHPSARVRHQKGDICNRCNRKNNPEWIASRQARLKREAGVA